MKEISSGEFLMWVGYINLIMGITIILIVHGPMFIYKCIREWHVSVRRKAEEIRSRDQENYLHQYSILVEMQNDPKYSI
jgi:hypothetical protein